MSEFDTPNYAEYSYSVKSEGKIKLLRRLMLFGYVAFAAAYFTVCVITMLIPLVAPLPIFIWMLIFFTWRYVSYDCYFTFQSGNLELGKARNGKGGMKKTPKIKIRLKEASFAGQLKGNEEKIKNTKLYDFSESQGSDKRIIVVFDLQGEKCSAVFEGTKKIAKLIDSFCPQSEGIKNLEFHG